MLLVPAVVTGCSYMVRGDACSGDEDCAPGSACVSGYCFEVEAPAVAGEHDARPDGGADGAGQDTGPADAGPADTGPVDASRGDAGSDSGAPSKDGGPGPADAADGGDAADAGDAEDADGDDPDSADVPAPDACLGGDGDGDGVECPEDCDDGNRNVHPGASELCNGVDDDCDGAIDPGCPQRRPGWPVELLGLIRTSSPAIAAPDPDRPPCVVVGSDDGLEVVNGDGEALDGWPQADEGGLTSSPAVAAFDPAAGLAERRVIAGSDAGLAVFGWDGVLAWRRGDPKPSQWAGPAVADVLGAGSRQIVAPTLDGRVALVRGGGELVGEPWPLSTGDVSAPALADVTGAGETEVVLGGRDGRVWVVGAGGPADGWPLAVSGRPLTAPVVGDVDGDGSADVVVADQDGEVTVLAGDASEVWTRSLGAKPSHGLALAPLPGPPGAVVVVGDEGGRLYLLGSPLGDDLAGWPKELGDEVCGAPVVVDVTRDQVPDVLASTQEGLVYAFEASGAPVRGFPLHVGDEGCSYLAVGDLDDDGRADVVAASQAGRLHAWELDVETWDPAAAPWPMDRRDPARTGALP